MSLLARGQGDGEGGGSMVSSPPLAAGAAGARWHVRIPWSCAGESVLAARRRRAVGKNHTTLPVVADRS